MNTRKSRDAEGRPWFCLAPDLEKSLSAYAVAAAAAGVSFLALASSAKARIVYTPADTPIPVNGGLVPLDLNNDGVVDFSFTNWSRTTSHVRACLLEVFPEAQGNAVFGRGTFGSSFFNFSGAFAVAVRPGFAVGPNKSYFHKNVNGIMGVYKAGGSGSNFATYTYGQWLNTKRRYLGFQFLINSQVHYGWARLKVTSQTETKGFSATLTGYAYETIPGKAIVAGKTHGPDEIVNQTTLGELAAGRK